MKKEQILQIVREALRTSRKVKMTLSNDVGLFTIISLIAKSSGKSISLSHDAETALRIFALHPRWERDEDRTMIVTFTHNFEKDGFVEIVQNAIEKIEVSEIVKLKNPDFPANRHNLVNGSALVCKHQAVQATLGIKVGDPIILGWTGKYVRFSQFTWSVEDICQEIDSGYWKIVGASLDFSDPKHLELFNQRCSPELDTTE